MLTRIFGFFYSGADTINDRVSVTAGAELNLDEAIPAGSVALTIPTFKLDVSQVRGIMLRSDQPLTLKTNNSGSPVNTIALAAKVPFLWVSGGDVLRDTNGTAITTDITGLFVDCPGEVDATLAARVIYDPTP